MGKRFWQCDCCLCMVVTDPQDDASKYECPQCKISGCDTPGTFVEGSRAQFMKSVNEGANR
jgi:hypothetical protein